MTANHGQFDRHTKRSIGASEIWFYTRKLKIPWTDKMSNINVFDEAERLTISCNHEKETTILFGYFMR